jgi:hypothetical protein
MVGEQVMAFVNEKISAEDAAKIDWSKFTAGGFEPIGPYKWTIDRDKDVFLVRLRTMPEFPNYMGLCWKGELIIINAFQRLKNEPGSKMSNVSWDIVRIHIPPALMYQRQTIISDLKEALDVYGYLYSHDGVGRVSVSIR